MIVLLSLIIPIITFFLLFADKLLMNEPEQTEQNFSEDMNHVLSIQNDY